MNTCAEIETCRLPNRLVTVAVIEIIAMLQTSFSASPDSPIDFRKRLIISNRSRSVSRSRKSSVDTQVKLKCVLRANYWDPGLPTTLQGEGMKALRGNIRLTAFVIDLFGVQNSLNMIDSTENQDFLTNLKNVQLA